MNIKSSKEEVVLTQPKLSKTHAIVNELRSEKIETWFDLGLFLDRVRDQPPKAFFNGNLMKFNRHVEKGGIGMVTFYYNIDGITVEANKYAKILKNIYHDVPIHYIAGEIHPRAEHLIDSPHQKEIKELNGFDNWPLYATFFKEKLERGSAAYNQLITDFWEETLTIVEKLGGYIEEQGINLLYVINVCSNPGNVSLALAIVLLSEYYGIPVVNNNHDFYWEGGNRKVDIETKGLKKGPRDFFFTNADVGEFFSVIEMIYPWQRKSWMTVNINKVQFDKVIHTLGHNPANVAQISTAIEYNSDIHFSKRNILRAFKQVATIFENEHETITVNTVEDYIQSAPDFTPVLLGHETVEAFDFVNNNIVFLQPTRVISRKWIEQNFNLISTLVEKKRFRQKFEDNPGLKISLIVSGPIPPGQVHYFTTLLNDYKKFVKKLPKKFRSKIFLGFLFSEFDKDTFKNKYKSPVNISHLYNIASLILLPSETEGRGLPILEAAASGTPIFCRQYSPVAVYEDVIGTHLSESKRLKVLDFKGKKLSKKLINNIINQVFYPQNNLHTIQHNLNVVKDRYSYEALENNLREVLIRLHFQLQSIAKGIAVDEMQIIFKRYEQTISTEHPDVKAIMNVETRHYMPGYGRLSFMIYLKSLIDPSFFRVEEQLFRGRILHYAYKIQQSLKDHSSVSEKQVLRYFNLVEAIFEYEREEYEIRHDHAIAYRHRNKKHLAYMDYTYQELIGLVNMIYQEVFHPITKAKPFISPQFFIDWELALHQLTNSETLAIDDRKRLSSMLKRNTMIGYFPGKYIRHELEYFILQPFRELLGLKVEDELTEELLIERKNEFECSYIFVAEPVEDIWFSNHFITEYIESDQEPELTLLYDHGLIQIVKTKQWCNGVHFGQMGEEALAKLKLIKANNGFLITNGEQASMMTDIIDIDHFHIGKAADPMTARVMGIPENSGFIQFVPAGVRTTLAYPTPIQTSLEFSEVLSAPLFKQLAHEYGEEELFKLMGEDAATNGTPIKRFLTSLANKDTSKQASITCDFIGGIYDDGLPWNGVMAQTNTKKINWEFNAYLGKNGPKNVPTLLKEYAQEYHSDKDIKLAWNGGYILNPELVGKLGLSEQYIGSPLGLLVLDSKVQCPPLFNKPAFLIYKDGRIDIEKVKCDQGFIIQKGNEKLEFPAMGYNTLLEDMPCFYDLFHEEQEILANGQVIVRLAGTTVKEIIRTKKGQTVPIIPVGVTLCIPEELFSEHIFAIETPVDLILTAQEDNGVQWSEIAYAIEAGPMLLEKGECVIDMHAEGWKTQHSIRTQAARLDFTDMRGPKIAIGIDDEGVLKVLAVNGRIRESVGATHYDMAGILKAQGMKKAMGFDPGGSSTLYVNGEIMNISPYNKRYEENIFSLPPEPRFVSNIILGWTNDPA